MYKTEAMNLSQCEVRRLFDYNPETGDLVRKITVSSKGKKGQVAGSIGPQGYILIKINQVSYRVHRIIWLWLYGVFPKNEMDHINHNRADNRRINIREATHLINSRNLSMSKRNTSGTTGVHWCKGDKRWGALISVSCKRIFLGHYKKIDDAIQARGIAEKKYGFHKNHGER